MLTKDVREWIAENGDSGAGVYHGRPRGEEAFVVPTGDASCAGASGVSGVRPASRYLEEFRSTTEQGDPMSDGEPRGRTRSARSTMRHEQIPNGNRGMPRPATPRGRGTGRCRQGGDPEAPPGAHRGRPAAGGVVAREVTPYRRPDEQPTEPHPGSVGRTLGSVEPPGEHGPLAGRKPVGPRPPPARRLRTNAPGCFYFSEDIQDDQERNHG